MLGVSTNRDRATPYRGHRRYFHRWSRVGRWRFRLTLLALVLALGWAAAGLISRDRLHADVTHGPLARAHAPWDAKCDACHIPYGDPGCTDSGVLECRDRWRAFRCDGCHAGPKGDEKNYAPHYTADHLKPDDTARDCSSCHHDHQGRDFALARVTDAGCVRCHENLKPFELTEPPAGKTPVAPTVTAFHRDHPEFRALTRPPERALKFNHGLHLAYGLAAGADKKADPKSLFALRDVDARFRGQYGRNVQPAGDELSPVQLDCAACHQLDPGRQLGAAAAGGSGLPAEAAFPARPGGAYYLPITFEKHCQGCHSLNVSGLVTPAGLGVAGFEVPHRLQPPQVEKVIRGEVARQVAEQKQLSLKTPLPPSDRVDTPRTVDVPSDLRAETERLVAKYQELLFDWTGQAPAESELKGGYACLKCHTSRTGDPKATRPTVIDPTPVRTIWLPNGRFDHSAHRAVNCKECHDMWDQPGDARRMGGGWAGEAVNLKGGVATCKECHAPQTGVKHGCVDCHRYHGADHPLHGPGSPLRDPPPGHRFDINAFLRGPRPPARSEGAR